ncbi:MAG: dihydroxyacetone kinase subunit L [Clostridiales bacterium]|nr:dihydroxyacetone kinase subunit L [Clostridiales bacterium]
MATASDVIKIIHGMADVIGANKEFLTDLDAAIGDSDHGINMNRGFQAVLTKLPPVEDKDIGTILKTVGMGLLSTVGGASGPLYGTAFIKASMKGAGKTEIGMEDFLAMLKDAIDGIMYRGKSHQGEKTMLDAMIPAYEAIDAAVKADQPPKAALAAGVAAAEKGVEYTKTIIATKGRASYLGERSMGHQDPGATSFTLLLKVIADAA